MSTLLRVLIVEDSEDDAELSLRELRRGGYDPAFERVESAVAMRAALEAGGWDLVVSDYHLPQFSAPDALAVLKQSGLDVPFIVVSGFIGEEAAVEILLAGAHDFIVKTKLARLLPAIQRELREAADRRERRRVAAALRESEAHYRAMLEALPDTMFRFSREGVFLDFKPAPGFETSCPRVNSWVAMCPRYCPRSWPGKPSALSRKPCKQVRSRSSNINFR